MKLPAAILFPKKSINPKFSKKYSTKVNNKKIFFYKKLKWQAKITIPVRLPRLYRRGTRFNRLLSVPTYREFALIPTLTDGEFPLKFKVSYKP